MYKPGGLASCKSPLCCQADDTDPTNPEDAAGYWGDYRKCDAPLHAVVNAFDEIRRTHVRVLLGFIPFVGKFAGFCVGRG